MGPALRYIQQQRFFAGCSLAVFSGRHTSCVVQDGEPSFMSALSRWPGPLLVRLVGGCVILSDNAMSHQGQPHIPGIGFCEDKQRLLDEFLKAIREVTALLNQKAEAVIVWDSAFSRFELLLHLAHEKKDAAKYALIAHIEAHHCEEA